MHDFTFNGQSLLSLGGRIVQPPVHTVARRSTERVKLYGRSGDEIIDNESYDNVDFSLKIALLPHLTQRTAHDLATSTRSGATCARSSRRRSNFRACRFGIATAARSRPQLRAVF